MKLTAQLPVTELTSAEEQLVYALQLLGDRTRFKLFKLLSTGQELCVSAIAAELGISVSAVSQHFRSFEMVGLVHKERAGQKICYSLREDNYFVRELSKIINKLMPKS